MGLLDSMFGGGTNLQLTLDTPEASAGGVVGGKISLTGGKKPLKVTELQVKLLYVCVTAQDDSPLPKIDTRILLTQTVAAGEDLPPGQHKQYSFRFTVPHGTETTAHNVSYKVLAAADIPSVKDPSADADLRVVDAEDDENRLLALEEVFGRFPDLRSQNEGQQIEALRELFLACYSEGGQFMEVEPFLSDLMRRGTVGVRRGALEAWANLVDNRVKPEHLQTLYNVANMPGLDEETFDQVIIAACKFAEEGAIHLVQQLAQHPSSHVRKEIASNLRFNAAERFAGKREIVIQLAQDQDPAVRAAAVGTFSCFRDDQQIMHGVAGQIDRDPSPAVQAAGIATLALAHHHGMGDLTFAVYEKHLANPNPEVRKEIASSINWLPKQQFQRIWGLVQRLLQDPEEDVRSAMAFQFYNLSELPQLLPLAQHTIQNDPSPDVRREALSGVSNMMKPEQAVALYSQVLAADQSDDTQWAVLSGLRSHREHPQAKKLLLQLASSPNQRLADAAREELTNR
jgi:HEAT repeat protein